MLSVNNLEARYGSAVILKDITFSLKKGEILSIVGSNGAGKTTLTHTIVGMITPTRGTIKYLGSEIQGVPAYDMLKLGICLVPEGRRIFDRLSVYENLLAGAYITKDKRRIQQNVERMYEMFPILKERRQQKAGTFSGGQQQMLAIARGLMSDPKLLILDEPSLGLSPSVTYEVFKTVRYLREEGLTIILVEQNVQDALELCDHAIVIDNGVIGMHGTGEEMLDSDMIRKAYLGL